MGGARSGEGYQERRWDEAFRDIDRAIEANPSLAIAYYHRSWFECLFGRMDEAIEDHRRAQQLDPFNAQHTAWLGELYRMEGRHEEAMAEAIRAIEVELDFPIGYLVNGLVLEDLGNFDEAIASMREAEKRNPVFRWTVCHALAKARRTAEARSLLAELDAEPPRPMGAFWRSVIYGILGDNDQAFHWLEYEPHHPWAPWILEWNPPLEKDPRWPAAARRFNLTTIPSSRSSAPSGV